MTIKFTPWKKSLNANIKLMETFNYVKNVLDTIKYRHSRMKDICAEIEISYRNEENVRIVYDTDVEENKFTVSKIWRKNNDCILLKNLKMIPLLAIKKVELEK